MTIKLFLTSLYRNYPPRQSNNSLALPLPCSLVCSKPHNAHISISQSAYLPRCRCRHEILSFRPLQIVHRRVTSIKKVDDSGKMLQIQSQMSLFVCLSDPDSLTTFDLYPCLKPFTADCYRKKLRKSRNGSSIM